MAVEKETPELEEELRVADEETEGPAGVPGPVDVQVEGEEEVEQEPANDFNSNLAESMDERTLREMASELTQEYKKDKLSRKDWEDAYIKGLDLLGTKYLNVTRPFKGASNVTHPMLAEATTSRTCKRIHELSSYGGDGRVYN